MCEIRGINISFIKNVDDAWTFIGKKTKEIFKNNFCVQA